MNKFNAVCQLYWYIETELKRLSDILKENENLDYVDMYSDVLEFHKKIEEIALDAHEYWCEAQ